MSNQNLVFFLLIKIFQCNQEGHISTIVLLLQEEDAVPISNNIHSCWRVISRYNRKGTLSGIPKTGPFLVQGPKIPRQFR